LFILNKYERLAASFLVLSLLIAFIFIIHKNSRPPVTFTVDLFDTDIESGIASSTVNINTADVNELIGLKGIGKSMANAIIRYRETHGLFLSIDEIKKVNGIGEKTFENIKDGIAVE